MTLACPINQAVSIASLARWFLDLGQQTHVSEHALQVSSSVAAVTILPSATELAIAWRYWYKAAKCLSRLRFIRRRIIELGGHPVGQKLVVEDLEDQKPTASYHRTNTDESIRRQEYSAEVLGAGIEDDVNDEFWKSLNLGPEQVAVYSMEFSKVSRSRKIDMAFCFRCSDSARRDWQDAVRMDSVKSVSVTAKILTCCLKWKRRRLIR